jgi:hypothetical protein
VNSAREAVNSVQGALDSVRETLNTAQEAPNFVREALDSVRRTVNFVWEPVHPGRGAMNSARGAADFSPCLLGAFTSYSAVRSSPRRLRVSEQSVVKIPTRNPKP